jgi:hemolysin-activating ACP:hemolysin acyltransferase
LSIFGKRKPAQDDTFATLGYIASLLALMPNRPHLPVAVALQLAEIAVGLDQYKIYFAPDGKPVAFISWALLSADVEERVIRSKSIALHVSEWNEGSSPWIVDFVAPFGRAPQILCDLRDGLFCGRETVRYLRIKPARVLIKEIARQSTASFFSRGTVPALCGPTTLPGWSLGNTCSDLSTTRADS